MTDTPGNSELLEAIESLEWSLSDGGGILGALTLGCKHLNGTTAPIVSLFRAREKLQKIKIWLASNTLTTKQIYR